jgi:hypothetical protein
MPDQDPFWREEGPAWWTWILLYALFCPLVLLFAAFFLLVTCPVYSLYLYVIKVTKYRDAPDVCCKNGCHLCPWSNPNLIEFRDNHRSDLERPVATVAEYNSVYVNKRLRVQGKWKKPNLRRPRGLDKQDKTGDNSPDLTI